MTKSRHCRVGQGVTFNRGFAESNSTHYVGGMQNDGNNSGGTIGGYVVVEHRFCNGWHDHAVTHAFGDLPAAEKHVEGRIEQITRRDGGYAPDETWLLNHDDHPTLHAVSPRIFAKAQDHLSRGHDYDDFAHRLGTAIARHTKESEGSRAKYPYTYRVGEVEVFATKSEYAAATVGSPAVDARAVRDRLLHRPWAVGSHRR